MEPNSKSIMLVENDHQSTLSLIRFLNNSGFEVIHAKSGEQAISLIEDFSHKIDLILISTSSELPEKSGFVIASEILKVKDIPVIFLIPDYNNSDNTDLRQIEEVDIYSCIPRNSSERLILSNIKIALKLFNSLTEERTSLELLKQSQFQLHELLETSNDGIYALDKHWRFTFLNSNTARVLRRNSEDLLGKEIWKEFPEIINTNFARTAKYTMEEGKTARIEEYFEILKGWLEISVFPSRQGISVYFREISERKIIEEELEKQKSFFEQVFIQSATSTQILDKDGWCLRINPKLSELFGVSPENLEGHVYNIFRDGEIKRQGIDKILKKVFTENKVATWEVYFDIGTASESQNINVKEKKKAWYFNKAYPILNQSNELMNVIIQHEDISEQKYAEEALREREELFRNVFDNSTTGVCLTGTDGRLIRVNDTFCNMLGYSPEELLSFEFNEITHPEDKQLGLTYMNDLLSGKIDKAIFEKRYIRKDGEIIWCYLSISVVRESNSVPAYFISHIQDVSERRKAKELLKENEEQLRTLFENAVLGIYRTTPDGRIIKANQALSKKLGYNSPDELMKRNLEEDGFLPNYSRKHFKDLFNENNDNVCIESRWNKTDGSIMHVRENSRAVRDKTGNIIFFDGTVEDITERKIAEAALVSSEKKYRLLFENSPLPMWILDLNTQKFLEVNKAAIEHYGYSKEEFSEMIITDLNPSKTRISDIEKDTYEPGTLITSRHIKKNNEIISVEVIFHTIEYEGKEARLVLSNDITERLKAQEDLIRAKKEAEKSDKLKSEFLAQMSHEIRSPINTLLNFISLIKETVPKPLNEDMSFCFNAIDSSSGRLIRTIDLILNMSQIQTGSLECNFQVIDLHKDVLQSILNEYSPLAESKELKLNLHNEYGIPRVTADVYSVGQIFSNLINNAIKYTKTGEIGIRIYGNQGDIKVDVSDTGIGISKEYLSEIFTPFSQEEQGYTRRFEGNGLGLALVKKYCELNKTSISVQSEKGVGTVFTVTFPGDSI